MEGVEAVRVTWELEASWDEFDCWYRENERRKLEIDEVAKGLPSLRSEAVFAAECIL